MQKLEIQTRGPEVHTLVSAGKIDHGWTTNYDGTKDTYFGKCEEGELICLADNIVAIIFNTEKATV